MSPRRGSRAMAKSFMGWPASSIHPFGSEAPLMIDLEGTIFIMGTGTKPPCPRKCRSKPDHSQQRSGHANGRYSQNADCGGRRRDRRGARLSHVRDPGRAVIWWKSVPSCWNSPTPRSWKRFLITCATAAAAPCASMKRWKAWKNRFGRRGCNLQSKKKSLTHCSTPSAAPEMWTSST